MIQSEKWKGDRLNAEKNFCKTVADAYPEVGNAPD